MISRIFYGCFRSTLTDIRCYISKSKPMNFTLRTLTKSSQYSGTITKFCKRLNIYQQITEQNKRFYHKAKNISLNINSKGLGNIYKNQDICIYVNENTRFYRNLTLFSVSQFIFWSYLSYVSYSTMRDIPVTEEVEEEVKRLNEKKKLKTYVPLWRYMNLGQYKNVLSGISATCGLLALCLATLYTTKSVKTIILKKGGENVMIQFFGPFGSGRQCIIPLSNISAKTGRRSASSYIILKLKNVKLHVIVDSKGTFPNTDIFDTTVGTHRSWAD